MDEKRRENSLQRDVYKRQSTYSTHTDVNAFLFFDQNGKYIQLYASVYATTTACREWLWFSRQPLLQPSRIPLSIFYADTTLKERACGYSLDIRLFEVMFLLQPSQRLYRKYDILLKLLNTKGFKGLSLIHI